MVPCVIRYESDYYELDESVWWVGCWNLYNGCADAGTRCVTLFFAFYKPCCSHVGWRLRLRCLCCCLYNLNHVWWWPHLMHLQEWHDEKTPLPVSRVWEINTISTDTMGQQVKARDDFEVHCYCRINIPELKMLASLNVPVVANGFIWFVVTYPLKF